MDAITAEDTPALMCAKRKDFYLSNLHKWADGAEETYGNRMLSNIRSEVIRNEAHQEEAAYQDVLHAMYKVVMDSMMSSVHRNIPFYHVNRSSYPSGFSIASDTQELLLTGGLFDVDGGEEDSEEDDTSSLPERNGMGRTAGTVGGSKASSGLGLKKEMPAKNHHDDEELLKSKKVYDEKHRLYNTLGPFPPPRLHVPRTVTVETFPSRKSLTQRLNTANLESIETDLEPDSEKPFFVPPSSQGPSESHVDAAAHLAAFMKPLSLDSLKKISESAKLKMRGSTSSETFISSIVKAVSRFGCEKAHVLMEKQKHLLDGTPSAIGFHGQLGNAGSLELLSNLPEPLRLTLGTVLGLTEEEPEVADIWERIVSMGLLSVLTVLRPGPLKRIAQELGITITQEGCKLGEKYCEAVVFSAFPKEQERVRNTKRRRQRFVLFSVPSASMKCVGDMGFITFVVRNISSMAKDADRHYSPEFEFGQLKWSLLCMMNKESLALYLCQTGTVFCKFLITVVNENRDESICNEGTQRFSSASSENDWGFNTVVKFDALLDEHNGFWNRQDDSITIEVGIVFVETPKCNAGKPVKEKQVAPKQVFNQELVDQLLESERVENLLKRISQNLGRTIKEEDRTRKDLTQGATKKMKEIMEMARSERARLAKALQEQEKREHQERLREQERIRQAYEQIAEMKRKVEQLTEENKDLITKKRLATTESKTVKALVEEARRELFKLDEEVAEMCQRTMHQDKRVELLRDELEEALAQQALVPEIAPFLNSDEEEEGETSDDDTTEKGEGIKRLQVQSIGKDFGFGC